MAKNILGQSLHAFAKLKFSKPLRYELGNIAREG